MEDFFDYLFPLGTEYADETHDSNADLVHYSLSPEPMTTKRGNPDVSLGH
jgi:hypothetical protein